MLHAKENWISLERRYTSAELWADGIVHAVALVLAIAGVIVLALAVGARRNGIELSATLIYGTGLVAMLAFSFAYNMVRDAARKIHLRRLDHSGIYFMIAGTYTPLLTQIQDVLTAWLLGGAVWIGAIAGIVLKYLQPARFANGSVAIYLGLSWIGVLGLKPILDSLPGSASTLLLSGGAVYTLGILFFLWEQLKFHNAIWHGFVATAASCHYGAIAACMLTGP